MVTMIARLLEKRIHEALKNDLSFFILGPRQTGKTTLITKVLESIEHIEYNLMETKERLNIKNDSPIFEPKGCSKCKNTGYMGRIGIFEVLPVDEKIKTLIVRRAATKEIAQQAVTDGMRTMIEDGFVKAARGLTSIEEVLRVIIE